MPRYLFIKYLFNDHVVGSSVALSNEIYNCVALFLVCLKRFVVFLSRKGQVYLPTFYVFTTLNYLTKAWY